MVWKSFLPYRIRFRVRTTRVERPALLEGEADGELAGTGRWRLFEQDGVTAVLYEWDVATTRPWMSLLAPVARPVFKWNHDWVTARCGESVARCSAAACSPAASWETTPRSHPRYLFWRWHSTIRSAKRERARFWLYSAHFGLFDQYYRPITEVHG
jgi:hypothetical protein